MRVLMLAPGSRGDVEPAARIGHDLTRDGHAVTMVAQRDYADAVARAGCTQVSFSTPLDPPHEQPGAPGARAYLEHLRGYMRDAAATALAAARPGTIDAVITNPISPYGHDIAEHLDIPSAEALLQPDQPSRAYPPMIASRLRLGAWGNAALGRAARRLPSPVTAATAWLRERLGLPHESAAAARTRRMAAGLPVHHGISPVLLPRPADWPENLSLDGTWWPLAPETAWRPAGELVEFLAAGPPPVLVTMGSVAVGGTVGAALSGFVERTRRRVIVQDPGAPSVPASDRAGGPAGARVLTVGHVPHEWLLPRVAACVHQSGAGIAAACLRAGIASILLPQHTDQFFWADRLRQLGAGVATPHGRRLTPVAIEAAAEAALAPAVHSAAHELSGRLRDGVPDDTHGVLPSTVGLRDWLAVMS